MPQELPAFPCPCCHERSFTKRPVGTDDSGDSETTLTHLHVCHACGENYLSTVQVAADRSRTETWDYYVDRQMALRRVRRYEPSGAYGLAETEQAFVFRGEPVPEAEWRAALEAVRATPSPLIEALTATAIVDRLVSWWMAADRPPVPSSVHLHPTFRSAAAGRRAA